MKIEIHTSDPSGLWKKIKKDIEDKKIKTWMIVQDSGNTEYLTHSPDQWVKKALLHPTTTNNPTRLMFTVTWFSNSEPTEYIKGLYIGRFTEELLEHYRSNYTKLEIFAS